MSKPKTFSVGQPIAVKILANPKNTLKTSNYWVQHAKTKRHSEMLFFRKFAAWTVALLLRPKPKKVMSAVEPSENPKNRISIEWTMVLQPKNLKHFLKMFLCNFLLKRIISHLRPQLNIRRSNVTQRNVWTALKTIYTMLRTKILLAKSVFPS